MALLLPTLVTLALDCLVEIMRGFVEEMVAAHMEHGVGLLPTVKVNCSTLKNFFLDCDRMSEPATSFVFGLCMYLYVFWYICFIIFRNCVMLCFARA